MGPACPSAPRGSPPLAPQEDAIGSVCHRSRPWPHGSCFPRPGRPAPGRPLVSMSPVEAHPAAWGRRCPHSGAVRSLQSAGWVGRSGRRRRGIWVGCLDHSPPLPLSGWARLCPGASEPLSPPGRWSLRDPHGCRARHWGCYKESGTGVWQWGSPAQAQPPQGHRERVSSPAPISGG